MIKSISLIIILIFCCGAYSQHDGMNSSLPELSGSARGSDSQPAKRQRPPYRVLRTQYVGRSTVIKAINPDNGVRIRLMQNGRDNTDIEDFSMAYDSGTEYHYGNIYGIENSVMPLYLKVTYRSWNAFHAVQSDVSFEMVIYHPGTWDVTIFN
jgi:hypothetical protein